jgi:acyl carrier protein
MTKNEFYTIVDQIAELPRGSLTGDRELASIEGWDSLSFVAFIAAFDKHFGAPPPPTALLGCTTVADLAALAGDKLSE